MRELRSAVLSHAQIIALLEVDQARGALDPPQIRTIVGELDWPEAERERALDKLFAEGKEPIEWTRLGSLQTLTLRLIAERLLPPRVGGTYVQHDSTPRVESIWPVRGRYHLCYSPHNEGVDRLLRELADVGCDVEHTSDLERLGRCACLLLYLNTQTWQSGPARERLEADVARAMDASVPLVLVHETVSFGLPVDRHSCDFSHFFEDDATPKPLIARGIYDKTAVSMRAGACLRLGLMSMLMAMFMSLCACLWSCARVCVRVRACVRACVCVVPSTTCLITPLPRLSSQQSHPLDAAPQQEHCGRQASQCLPRSWQRSKVSMASTSCC